MRRLRARFNSLTLEHLPPMLLLVFAYTVAVLVPIGQTDFWFHLTIGEDILITRSIPMVDEYSHTQFGEPYASYQQFWLSDVVLQLLFRAGGPALILLVHAIAITATYALVMRVVWLASLNWPATTIGTAFAVALGFTNWNVRPQTAAFLSGSLIVALIAEHRRSGQFRWLAGVPLVMMFWVNAHGTFAIGLAFVGLWFLEEASSAFKSRGAETSIRAPLIAAWTLAVSALATLANPMGPGVVGHVAGMTSNDSIQRHVTEWQPPDATTLVGGLFVAGMLFVVVLFAWSPRRPSLAEMLTFLIFAVLSLLYIRAIVWFGIALAPIVGAHTIALLVHLRKASPRPPDRGERRFVVGVSVVLLTVSICLLPSLRHLWTFAPDRTQLISDATPVEAARYLTEHDLPGELFNSMVFGSYLIWAVGPQHLVFADSRIELFPEEVWDDYLIISDAGYGWDELLDDYRVRTLFLDAKESEVLIRAATESGSWTTAYDDEIVVILTRD